jgi:hypothetical protein
MYDSALPSAPPDRQKAVWTNAATRARAAVAGAERNRESRDPAASAFVLASIGTSAHGVAAGHPGPL